MTIRKFSLTIIFIAFLVLSILGVLVYQIDKQYQEIHDKENNRLKVIILISELIHNSDQLTRMARNYVITKDPVYETYFNEELKLPKDRDFSAKGHSIVYRYLFRQNGKNAGTENKVTAVYELLQQEKLIESELGLVNESIKHLTVLNELEKEAFQAMKGIFDDGSRSFLINREPDSEFARKLLFGEAYIQGKEKIKDYLERALLLFESRNQTELNQLENQIEEYITFQLTLIGAMFLGTLFCFSYVRRSILQPLFLLDDQAHEIARGNYSVASEVKEVNELGALSYSINVMVEAIHRETAKLQYSESLLKQNNTEVVERVKELECLKALTELGQSDVFSFDVFFYKIISLLQKSFQYPEDTYVSIIFDQKAYQIGKERESKWYRRLLLCYLAKNGAESR